MERRVKLVRLRQVEEPRGHLSAAEFGLEVPFLANRYFLVYEVPEGEIRGGHAHRICQQFLICCGGGVTVRVDDGRGQDEFRLTGPESGLYIPSLIWSTQTYDSKESVLLVFASHPYDREDYVSDYHSFKHLVNKV